MKYMFKIGWVRLFMDNNRGVATIMEALGRARVIEDIEYSPIDGHVIGVSLGPPPVVECVTLRGEWKTRARGAALEPDEVLPPVRGSLPSGQRAIAAGSTAMRLTAGGAA